VPDDALVDEIGTVIEPHNNPTPPPKVVMLTYRERIEKLEMIVADLLAENWDRINGRKITTLMAVSAPCRQGAIEDVPELYRSELYSKRQGLCTKEVKNFIIILHFIYFI